MPEEEVITLLRANKVLQDAIDMMAKRIVELENALLRLANENVRN